MANEEKVSGYELLEERYPRISEFTFVSEYLDDLVTPNATQETFNKWLTVAVNPLNRVEVVDDKDHDKVLFWIPPLRYSAASKVGGDLTRLMSESKALIARHQASGNRYMEEVLEQQDLSYVVPEEDVAQWGMILKRYNKMPKETNSSQSGADFIEEAEDDF